MLAPTINFKIYYVGATIGCPFCLVLLIKKVIASNKVARNDFNCVVGTGILDGPLFLTVNNYIYGVVDNEFHFMCWCSFSLFKDSNSSFVTAFPSI